jgi:mannose-6-phosphate isomerase-like protein (cupin superfamily)
MTPPNSQGLAPHHDDVDVFIMQVEGRKRWKLYSPIEHDLPREYSPDLDQEQLSTPSHTLTLEPGDFLYFPRGVVHQACTSNDHSTHLTLSSYQKFAWFDFLSNAFQSTLEAEFGKDRELREGLPVGVMGYIGANHKDNPRFAKKQSAFHER